MSISTLERYRRYIIARRLIVLGEEGLYQNFTRLQLRKISEALKIPRKSMNKLSHLMGLHGRLDVKRVWTVGLIAWANAVVKRDAAFFLLKRIEIE